jgi:hypothetical protein
MNAVGVDWVEGAVMTNRADVPVLVLVLAMWTAMWACEWQSYNRGCVQDDGPSAEQGAALSHPLAERAAAVRRLQSIESGAAD